MLHHLRKTIKSIFDKHPLIVNCLTYGTFTTSAEFLQQTISVNERSQDELENGKKVTKSLLVLPLSDKIYETRKDYNQI